MLQSEARRYQARTYQALLVEKAKSRNLLVILPTGSGKTHIAGLLAEHFLSQADNLNRIAICIVPSVILAHQQYEALLCSATYWTNETDPSETWTQAVNSRVFAGTPSTKNNDPDLNVNWSLPGTWKEMYDSLDEFKESAISWKGRLDSPEKPVDMLEAPTTEWPRLFVATYDKMLYFLQHGLAIMSRICLLIVDEFHHCSESSAVGLIMKYFYQRSLLAGELTPRVLGLSASPIEKAGNASARIKELCCLFSAEIGTDESIWQQSQTASSVQLIDSKSEDAHSKIWLAVLRLRVWLPFRTLLNIPIDPDDHVQWTKDRETLGALEGSHPLGVMREAVQQAEQASFSSAVLKALADAIWYRRMSYSLRRLLAQLNEILTNAIKIIGSHDDLIRAVKTALISSEPKQEGSYHDSSRARANWDQFESVLTETGLLGFHDVMTICLMMGSPSAALNSNRPLAKMLVDSNDYIQRLNRQKLAWGTGMHVDQAAEPEKSNLDQGAPATTLASTLLQAAKSHSLSKACVSRENMSMGDSLGHMVMKVLDSSAKGLEDPFAALLKLSLIVNDVARVCKSECRASRHLLMASLYEQNILESYADVRYWLDQSWRTDLKDLKVHQGVSLQFSQRKDLGLVASPKLMTLDLILAKHLLKACRLLSLQPKNGSTASSSPISSCSSPAYEEAADYFCTSIPLKVLVFCRTRLICQVVARFINRRGLCSVTWVSSASANCITNCAKWLSLDSRSPMEAKQKFSATVSTSEQKHRVEAFRCTNEFDEFRKQVLVATPVLEEGFDLPTCNLVIQLNVPLSSVQYVQARGRARCSGSAYIIIDDFDARNTKKMRDIQEQEQAALAAVSQSAAKKETFCRDGEVTGSIPPPTGSIPPLSKTAAYIVSARASTVLCQALQQLATSKNEVGLYTEPHLRLWMTQNCKSENDMLALYKGNSIVLPPVKGYRTSVLETSEIALEDALEVNSNPPTSKKDIAAVLCVKALNYLQEQSVLDKHYLTPCSLPNLKSDTDDLKENEILYRLPPICLRVTQPPTWMHTIWFEVEKPDSEIFVCGGLHGLVRKQDFQAPPTHSSNGGEDEFVTPSALQELESTAIKNPYVKISPIEAAAQEFDEAQAALTRRIEIYASFSNRPPPVQQPLGILLPDKLTHPLTFQFVHWATRELVRVHVRTDPSYPHNLSIDDLELLQSFQSLAFRLWQINNFIDKSATLDKAEPVAAHAVPPNFLLVPLKGDGSAIDMDYAAKLCNDPLLFQVGNLRLSEKDIPHSSLSVLSDIKRCWGEPRVMEGISFLEDTLLRQSESFQCLFNSLNDSKARPISYATLSPMSKKMRVVASPCDEIDICRKVRDCLKSRDRESLLLRSSHRRSNAFHFYRLEGLLSLDKAACEDLWNSAPLPLKDTPQETGIVLKVAKVRQGTRAGVSANGDRHERKETVIPPDWAHISPLTEPIAQQLSFTAVILWKLETLEKFLDAQALFLKNLNEFPVPLVESHSGPITPILNDEMTGNQKIRLLQTSMFPKYDLDKDIVRYALTAPGAVISDDVDALQLQEDVRILRLLEDHWGQAGAIPTMEISDDGRLSIIIEHFYKSADNDGIDDTPSRRLHGINMIDMVPHLPLQIPHSQVLEFLGDAVLKYVAALYVFLAFPSDDEGSLTMLADSMFKRNSVLRTLVRENHIDEYLLAKPFVGKRSRSSRCSPHAALREQLVSWKQQADIAEAVIAAVWWSNYHNLRIWPSMSSIYLLRHVCSCLSPLDLPDTSEEWNRLLSPYLYHTDWIGNSAGCFAAARMLANLMDTPIVLGVLEEHRLHVNKTFRSKNSATLAQSIFPNAPRRYLNDWLAPEPAASSRSRIVVVGGSDDNIDDDELRAPLSVMQNDHTIIDQLWFAYIPNYAADGSVGNRIQANMDKERLEFLGDACLGMLLTEWLHKVLCDVREGVLTLIKSILQSNRFLCLLVLRRSLAVCDESVVEALSSLSQVPASYITAWRFEVANVQNASDLTLATQPCAWDSRWIKLLADVYESLIGATLIEFDYDLRAVWEVIRLDFERNRPGIHAIIYNEAALLQVQLASESQMID